MKPFEASDLIAAVKRLSERKENATPAVAPVAAPAPEAQAVAPPPQPESPPPPPATNTTPVTPPIHAEPAPFNAADFEFLLGTDAPSLPQESPAQAERAAPEQEAKAPSISKPTSAQEPYDLPPLTEEDFAMLGLEMAPPAAPAAASSAPTKSADLPVFDFLEEKAPSIAPGAAKAPLDDLLSLHTPLPGDAAPPPEADKAAVGAAAPPTPLPAETQPPLSTLEMPAASLTDPFASQKADSGAADPLLGRITDFLPPAPIPVAPPEPAAEQPAEADVLDLSELAPPAEPAEPEISEALPSTAPVSSPLPATASVPIGKVAELDYATVAGVVQKVFDRYKPQLIAEIASELARLDQE